jgi:hypothetical protein
MACATNNHPARSNRQLKADFDRVLSAMKDTAADDPKLIDLHVQAVRIACKADNIGHERWEDLKDLAIAKVMPDVAAAASQIERDSLSADDTTVHFHIEAMPTRDGWERKIMLFSGWNAHINEATADTLAKSVADAMRKQAKALETMADKLEGVTMDDRFQQLDEGIRELDALTA